MSVRVNKDGSGVDVNVPGVTASTHELIEHVVVDEIIAALAMYVRDEVNIIRQHVALGLAARSVTEVVDGIRAKLKT